CTLYTPQGPWLLQRPPRRGESSNAISPWEVSRISHMLHEGVVDQKIYFSGAFDRDGEYVQVPRVYTKVLDPREGQYTCVCRGMNRVEPGRKTSSQERIRQWIYAGMREGRMRKMCGSGACNRGVRQGPGAQEAKPLGSCRGRVRLLFST